MGKITIRRAGPLTTVQDLGRPDQRRAGVSPGGALDSHAARVANLLMGNEENAALLEITLGKTRIRFHDERLVAWCGGEFQAQIAGQPAPPGRPLFVRRDEELEMGPPRRGCRAWIAFSGGIDLPLVLGSRSTDLRAGIGGLEGRFLRDGDELVLGKPTLPLPARARVASWGAPAEWAQTAQPYPLLRVVPGAEWADFSPEMQALLLGKPFTVSAKTDRMGARLEGPALRPVTAGELLSAAVAPGTIQVPNDGQPILLLGDCQTIGGYRKIAHVISVDFSIAAQLRPGDIVRFREVTVGEARELFLARENDWERFRVGLRLRGS